MQRREFLKTIGAVSLAPVFPSRARFGKDSASGSCCGPGYASPADAIRAPREQLLYTVAVYTGTAVKKPDYLATGCMEMYGNTTSANRQSRN